jgi:hypothetical protein
VSKLPSPGHFSGGKGFGGANQVFHAFGFPLGKKQELDGKRQELKRRPLRRFSPHGLLRKLFSQEWSLLPTKSEMKTIPNGKYPGIYVLAYSDEPLLRKRVLEKDVFYVGMTVEGGLSTRLYQFYSGIIGGRGHSAGQRFFRVWLKRKRYDRNAKTKLYFAYLPVMIEAVKEWRTSEDLRNLGAVTELEYEAIARVKHKLGHEPLLNKK